MLVVVLVALSGVGCSSGGTPAQECALGTYDDDGDAATACVAWKVCRAGEYLSAAGTLTSAPVCDACSPGEYCAGRMAAAVACTGTTWDHDRNPATVCATRTDCTAGQWVVSDGSAITNRTCTACAAGTYTASANASMCTPWRLCGAGYVEGAPGTATTDRTCVSEDEWTRQFGSASSDVAKSVSVGADGSVLVAGSTGGTLPGQASAGEEDTFVRQYDGEGSEVWTRQFGSAGSDVASSVSVGADGSVLVAGITDGTLPGLVGAGFDDAFVRMYDAAGTELWTRQFGTASVDLAKSVSVGADGSVLVAGSTGGTLPGQDRAGGFDAFVRKYDAAGTELWTRQFGSETFDSAGSVSVGADGSVLVAGFTNGTLPGQARVGRYDAFVRKYDASGNELWTRQFGTTSTDNATSVSVGADGSVLVAGFTNGAFPGESRTGFLIEDAFVRKYDASGNELWTRQFWSAGRDAAWSVSVAADGSVLVAGETSRALPGQISVGFYDAFVRKYDATGTELWTRQFGTSLTDWAWSVGAGVDGSVLVAGSTVGTFRGQTAAGDEDAFVMSLRGPSPP